MTSSSDPRVLFGKHLAELRRSRGWSQEYLALESGLARSYLGGVERGQRNIALLNIIRLANALELPPSKLLEFEDLAFEVGNGLFEIEVVVHSLAEFGASTGRPRLI